MEETVLLTREKCGSVGTSIFFLVKECIDDAASTRASLGTHADADLEEHVYSIEGDIAIARASGSNCGLEVCVKRDAQEA